MDRYAHGKEMFYLAALTLASGTGDIKTRLHDAAQALVGLRTAEEIPQNLRPEFESMWNELTRIPDENSGSLSATVNQMNDEEASKFAERIFSLYGKVLHGTSL